MADVFKQTAAALRLAVDQHGSPSRFAIGELHRLYGGPRPLDLGRLLRNGGAHYAMRTVTVHLGLLVEYVPGSPSFLRVADESGRFTAEVTP